jgi:cell wall-associated NlpC family hydrolase
VNYSVNDLNIEQIALQYINTAYLWGGRSPWGIDCSGFTQTVYNQIGIHLKRDAYQQAEQGEPLAFLSQAQMGDLAFFDNDEGKITHVGILLSNQKIIHASGKVKIEDIDNHGIINNETKKYSHKLRFIKRIKTN